MSSEGTTAPRPTRLPDMEDPIPEAGDKTACSLHDVAARLTELAEVTHSYAARLESGQRASGVGSGAAVTYLSGIPEINKAIDAAVQRACKEILTAQPDGPRPGPVLDGALETVRWKISHGVEMRTIYQHTTRFDEATKAYVRQVTEHGAQVRTLGEFFDRLIIIDAAIAFISANDVRTDAVAIEEPSVVRFLRDVFERSWDRAERFPFIPLHAAKAADDVIPSIRESIRRLLVEGYSDKKIARRLGISERSLQAHVASMKQALGAHNRLQLGYLLGRSETTIVL
ncbi:hypothetical protein VR41_07475 [Streptomyces sp. NRRL B-1568]|nr:hypothetical protein VR41_07475 [Streptomyces sp. NRRL B-1568]